MVNPKARDPLYFDPIFDELQHGGCEAFLHELMSRDYSLMNLREPPVTAALLAQREKSVGAMGHWAIDLARTGEVRDPKSERAYDITAGADIPVATVRDAVISRLGPSPTASLYAELLRRGMTCEQQVQRLSVAARLAASSRLSVAMESGT